MQLERSGTLEYRNERWFFAGIGYPAEQVSLRSVSAHKFAILDESQNYRMLEEMEETLAPSRLYPGAIYLHQGESYLISQLDLSTGIAYAKPVDVGYYTEPRSVSDIRIARVEQEKHLLLRTREGTVECRPVTVSCASPNSSGYRIATIQRYPVAEVTGLPAALVQQMGFMV